MKWIPAPAIHAAIIVALQLGARPGRAQSPVPDASYAPSRCGAARLPTTPDAIDRAALAWMGGSRTPASAIAVVRQGRVVAERAYGWADLVNCVPATPELRFGIGSISKQITALGLLLLVQQRKLALDDPIAGYFPESGAAWRGITIRHLLTHTSGIRDSGHDDEVYPQIELDKKQEVSDSALVARLAAEPVNFPPGEDRAYSNTGYILLSLIIQRASRSAFPVWMHQQVFEPLGMHATRFYDPAELIPALARGYTIRYGQLRQGYYSSGSFSRWGDMGIISTAHDMALWIMELDSSRLVSPALHREMLAPARLRDGSVYPYGFGVALDDYRGEPVLTHGGTYHAGYSANLLTMPERGLGVVVLTNQHQGDPWIFSGTLLGLADSTLRPVSALPAARDPAPERTARLAALLNGDSTAAPATVEWRRHMYPRIRGLLAEQLPVSLTYVACDDVSRRRLELFGAVATRECYYRLHHGGFDLVVGVHFASDDRIIGIAPRP